MRIKEVCERTGLTDRAIRYYIDAALLDFLRRDKCHAENIEDGFYAFEELRNVEPVVVELVARGNRQPLYSMSPID